jgi:selenocysteine lyase/cysteine desulfurase
MQQFGANPGRGGFKMSMDTAMAVFRVRQSAAEFFGASGPECVTFQPGCTQALNIVIGSLKPGDHVLVTDMEHNAVRRPALALKKRGVRVEYFHGYGKKEEILSSFERALAGKPDLAVFIHTSNVCPQSLPVFELCALCKKKGVLSLLDCAQAGGHLPLPLADLQADGLVLPGHKGLFGLQGGGALLCSERLKKALEEADTLVEGGSGSASLEEGMPSLLPERLEAGTLALPAIASLGAGVRFVAERGYGEIGDRLSRLSLRCMEGLSVIRGVKLCAPYAQGAGPLLFETDLTDNASMAEALSLAGVCVREGLHCAPLIHKHLNTHNEGLVRASLSIQNTLSEIAYFLRSVKKIANN